MTRKLDSLVAEKVMGWTFWLKQRGECKYVITQKEPDREPWKMFRYETWEKRIPNYSKISSLNIDNRKHILCMEWSPSTSISEAMELITPRHAIALERVLIHGVWQWMCSTALDGDWSKQVEHDGKPWSAQADTAPLSICLARLREVGVPESEITAAMEGER